MSNTAGIKTDYHGVAPRVGFDYSPQPGFVIRGGFGIGYIPMNKHLGRKPQEPPVCSYGFILFLHHVRCGLHHFC